MCAKSTPYASYKIRLTTTPVSAHRPMNVQHYFWMLPFISFLVGYHATQWLCAVKTITAPNLMGKYLHQALRLVSDHHIGLHLISQKEEPNIPEGIILTQTPAPGTLIKQNQSLYVVTTKKPHTPPAPECVGASLDTIMPQLHAAGIVPHICSLAHPYPEKMCFAQSPASGKSLINNKLILYVSAENNKPIVWPQLIGHHCSEVQEFLRMYNITPYIMSESSSCTDGIICDQRPIAGTLITLNDKQPLSVQLKITEVHR